MKKFILGILLFVVPFAVSGQIDSTIFKHESKLFNNGIESYTKIFLKDAYLYADSLHKEAMQTKAYADSLVSRVSDLEEKRNKLIADIKALRIALKAEEERLKLIAEISLKRE